MGFSAFILGDWAPHRHASEQCAAAEARRACAALIRYGRLFDTLSKSRHMFYDTLITPLIPRGGAGFRTLNERTYGILTYVIPSIVLMIMIMLIM